jgi:polyisoprenoid-binding protein YceI
MIKSLLLAGVFGAAMASPVLATDAVLNIPHTQAEFTVTHLAVSKVHGQIPLVSGTVTYNDAGMPTNADATFDMTGVDSRDSNRDNSLRTDYFETAKYPTMTFVEKKVEGTPKAFKMTGDLTLHGVTKSVVLTGNVDNSVMIGGKRHVGYSATTTIDRRDFGIVFAKMLDNQLFAGYDVTIDIETDAVEK